MDVLKPNMVSSQVIWRRTEGWVNDICCWWAVIWQQGIVAEIFSKLEYKYFKAQKKLHLAADVDFEDWMRHN